MINITMPMIMKTLILIPPPRVAPLERYSCNSLGLRTQSKIFHAGDVKHVILSLDRPLPPNINKSNTAASRNASTRTSSDIRSKNLLIVTINDDGLGLVGLYVVRAMCTQRHTRAHGVPASDMGKQEDLPHLAVVGDWLVQVLDILGVSLNKRVTSGTLEELENVICYEMKHVLV
jgi:hypothetical protein